MKPNYGNMHETVNVAMEGETGRRWRQRERNKKLLRKDLDLLRATVANQNFSREQVSLLETKRDFSSPKFER